MKIVSGLVLIPLLVGMLTLAFNIQPVKASGTIYVKADGSIDPPTANITSVDNVSYTLTGNINDSLVVERSNIIIDGNGYTLQGSESETGIKIFNINNVTIQNMNIKDFWFGIYIQDSDNNTLSGNNITTTTNDGVHLHRSANNVFRNNSMAGNRYSFKVDGSGLSDFIHDIDSSNTVDGKPLYYWVNRQDMEVPSDAGYVALVNSNNITVKGLELKNNGEGILMVNTSSSRITDNNIINNHYSGVYVRWSSNNTVSGNSITDNFFGIQLMSSNTGNNTVSGNNITSNQYGVYVLYSADNNIVSGNNIANNLYGVLLQSVKNNTVSGNNMTNNQRGLWLFESASDNTISENYIANNWVGIFLEDSSDNCIYHNNFVDNTNQVYTENSVNSWDDGYPSGGNYWSDYVGVDIYHSPNQDIPGTDGIGDAPYIIDANNRDNYPLMNPYAQIDASIKVKGNDYPVTIVSNTTIDQIVATKNTLHFESSGPAGETGYVRVIFPMVNTTEIKVLIDGQKLTPPPFPVITSNGTHYFIYFEFTLSTHNVALQFAPLAPPVPVGGVWVPTNKFELLAPWIGLASLITVATASVVYVKHRKKQQN